MNNLEEVKQILKDNNQEHLLFGYESMTEVNREKLLYQISKINFKLIKELYEKAKNTVSFEKEKIEPINYINKDKLPKEELEKYINKGEEIIKNGELAFVTMAGGQGTRLGHAGPKGTFILGEITNKSLFEIACDELKNAKEKYGVLIPWYIMTSEENNDDTIKFFEKNNYFNYPKNAIWFFKQGEIPMIDTNGKIMLEEDYTIKQGADGHGGIFEAMLKNDIISDMQKRNIKWVYTGGIDNVLAKPIDPICIGIGVYENAGAVGKSLVKANPEERVGVFCKRNGKPSVIEYTEISDEMARQQNENGELAYGEAHILCNMFNMKVIENISKNKLPYHPAFKKATYINDKGEKIIGDSPNGYKFETFIFDAFSMLGDMAILRVKREEEFAPVKNAEGTDSPKTARELYKNYWKM